MRDDAALERWADEVGAKVANCASCGAAVSRAAPVHLRQHRLAGRVKGRPLCAPCLDTAGGRRRGGRRAKR